MPIPTFTPPVRPSPGTSHAPQVKLLEAEFGDGYSQPTPHGINHIKKTVALVWSALLLEQRDDIVGFFERMGGSLPFYFQPYGEARMLKWTCKEWSSQKDGGVWSITATFVQSFTNEV